MRSFLVKTFHQSAIYCLTLLSLSLILYRFSDSQEGESEAAGKIHNLYSPQPVIELNELPEGEDTVATFELRNRGKTAYVIKNILMDFGCQLKELSSKNLPARGSAQIAVKFNSKGFSGAVERKIYIFTSEPKNQLIVLKLAARVNPQILIEPTELKLDSPLPNGPSANPQLLKVKLAPGLDPEKLQIVNPSEKTIKYVKSIEGNIVHLYLSITQNDRKTGKTKRKQFAHRLIITHPDIRGKKIKVVPIQIIK